MTKEIKPVAWIEHHKGGDNLIWELEKSSPRATPLYGPEAMERIKELEAQLASFAQGAKISIPTITMEQEFASYERRGFQRGVKHSEREYQTRYMLLEAQYKLLMDHCVALVAMKSPAPIMLERDRVIETDAFNLATKFTEIRKALEAENAELRKDAERYRWLR